MKVEYLGALEHREETAALFREYTELLIAGDPTFASYLDQQGFEEELAHLEGKYAAPEGRMFVLRVDGETAGCGGMKKLDEGRCELKRMYIRPAFRGRGLGRALALHIIGEARKEGYTEMLLDTLSFLTAAQGLYRSLGFVEIERYNDSPMEGATYMCLRL